MGRPKKKGIKKGTKMGIYVKRSISEKDWIKYKVKVIVKKEEVEKEWEDIPLICYWEIMYKYLNPEKSWAYPQHVFPRDKAEGRVYYGTKAACQAACNIENESEQVNHFYFNKIAGFQL